METIIEKLIENLPHVAVGGIGAWVLYALHELRGRLQRLETKMDDHEDACEKRRKELHQRDNDNAQAIARLEGKIDK